MEESRSRASETTAASGGGKPVRFLHSRWQALVFALLASALSLTAAWLRPDILENLDQRSRDVVFRWKEPEAPPPDVVIVAIDESSLKAHGRWPWPRSTQARLLSALKSYEPAVLALDIVYAQMSNEACQCSEQDELLAQALGEDGADVIGGYFFRPERTGEMDQAALDLMYENRIRQKLVRAGGNQDTVPELPFVETSEAAFASQMEGLGFFNRDTDVDGLVRSMRLLLKFDGEFYPSLALRALAAYQGEEPGITLDPTGVASIRLGSAQIPVDQQGRMTVNYYALENGVPVYSAADVIAGEIDGENLRGKVVFVGITETGVGDLVPTPVHGLFPGVAIHATGAANILQGNFLHDDLNTVLWDVTLIALIPLISVMFMAFIGRLWQMILAMVFFSGVLGLVFYYLVAYQAQLVSLIYPAAALIIAFTAFQVYYMLTSQRTTRFLTGAFSSYVPPDVVDKLLDTPDSLGLSGEDREVTVLFSDIRGFTGMSEKLEPQKLVDLLNEFFDEMTSIIQANNGTLDKFIGDAIMALFNAPLNVENHPSHAARAALGMMDRLNELQPRLQSEYGVDLNIGIGLHCGNAIVGNLGSTQRFDYTAVGDAVNLASRVEGASKYYGVPILHTRAVNERLDDSFLSRQLDRIRVSGKMEYAEVFHLMNKSPDQQQLAEQFQAAIDNYFAMDFRAARKQFEGILSGFPDDKPARIMLERCGSFLEQPPAGDWDGVYQATSK